MRLTSILAVSLLLATPAAFAADLAGIASARRALDTAVTHGDAAEIRAARDAFALLAAGDPQSPDLAYWLALADWRLVPLLLESDRDAAKQLVKEGIAACDRAVAARPKFADAVALKAGLQGFAYGFVSPQAGMALGAEMEEGYGRASGLAPENPRVLLLKGMNVLHKPKEVGGGPAKAKPVLEAAVAAFAKEAPGDSTSIGWGHDDALAWSGICASRLGDWSAARERFRQVLARNAEHAWTKHRLLPEAEMKLAAKTDAPAPGPK